MAVGSCSIDGGRPSIGEAVEGVLIESDRNDRACAVTGPQD